MWREAILKTASLPWLISATTSRALLAVIEQVGDVLRELSALRSRIAPMAQEPTRGAVDICFLTFS